MGSESIIGLIKTLQLVTKSKDYSVTVLHASQITVGNARSSPTNYNDNDNDKPIKSLLKGKGLLPPVGLARLDS
jgi:hypothetical protein